MYPLILSSSQHSGQDMTVTLSSISQCTDHFCKVLLGRYFQSNTMEYSGYSAYCVQIYLKQKSEKNEENTAGNINSIWKTCIGISVLILKWTCYVCEKLFLEVMRLSNWYHELRLFLRFWRVCVGVDVGRLGCVVLRHCLRLFLQIPGHWKGEAEIHRTHQNRRCYWLYHRTSWVHPTRNLDHPQ